MKDNPPETPEEPTPESRADHFTWKKGDVEVIKKSKPKK